ncbi:hypothetical protein ABZ896_24125 [Streptomyces sp. NPDC047072]|uniref:hypothetical protein n=1 Tax=Streptomyces sp. NPDC047072 TaxID=3154809 RepID=UPI0033FB1CBF
MGEEHTAADPGDDDSQQHPLPAGTYLTPYPVEEGRRPARGVTLVLLVVAVVVAVGAGCSVWAALEGAGSRPAVSPTVSP